ncbi:isochorismatase family protein [Acinetobacter beijerinckii]|uniref:cysteine hydrolase family protein n=1 Tax=Acinetobacter beijerinckii TaxID=262668 RepID=UPI0023DDD1D1|nr:cysteine hydrolase family protein [Acinetobacter beijerinckii]MDF2416217.1 isochorismatase family protein [Acinetobacter beijerinckii]
MKQALLIIDVQNDYFKNGKMELVNPDNALAKINQLEDHFIQNNLPIIYIQHINPASASFFQENTVGAELHPQLKVTDHSLIVEKHFPNSFLETNLQALLQQYQVEQLVITGMMTHVCIDSGTRAAKELGYQPIVITDATATRDLEYEGKIVKAADVQTAFLSALGFFATVQITADFLAHS